MGMGNSMLDMEDYATKKTEGTDTTTETTNVEVEVITEEAAK